MLRELRANAKILVAIGACAITGGLPAMRNRLDIGDILNEVYRDFDATNGTFPATRNCRCCSTRSIQSTRSCASTISFLVPALRRRDLEISTI